MFEISKKFLQNIATVTLDDFFLYRANCDCNELSSIKASFDINNFTFDKNKNLYDNIRYHINNHNNNRITIIYKDRSLTVKINEKTYKLYYIKNQYYIKYNDKCYKFLDSNEYYKIFTCIAILHSQPEYSNIFDEIFEIKFNKRFNTYRPAVYHILDGYLSSKSDGYESYKVDAYLKRILRDETVHFIEGIDNYILENNILTVTVTVINILTYDLDAGKIKLNFKNGESYIFYCVTKQGLSSHAISVVIHYKKENDNDVYYIFIVNSGFDMKSLQNYIDIINADFKYLRPFSCHKTEDINTITKLIFYIYFLNYLFYQNFNIKVNYLCNLNEIIDYTKDILTFISTGKEYNISYIKSYYTNILNKILENTYDESFLNTKYSPVDFDMVDELSTESFKHSINTDIQHKLQFHSFEISSDGLSYISQHGNMPNPTSNYNMLIIPPQQGTCTWFCKYWSLVLISLIKNNYSDFIKYMYKICIRDLTHILHTEYLDYDIDYMISIKILLSKLSNLNILKPKNQIQFYDLTGKSRDSVKLKLSNDSNQDFKISLDVVEDMASLVKFLFDANSKYTERNFLQILKKIIVLKSTLEPKLVIPEFNLTVKSLEGIPKDIKSIINIAFDFYKKSLGVINELKEEHIFLHNIKLYYLLSYLGFQHDYTIIKYYMKLSYFFYFLLIFLPKKILFQISTPELTIFTDKIIGRTDLIDINITNFMKFFFYLFFLQTDNYDDFINYDNFINKTGTIISKDSYITKQHFIYSLDHSISIKSVNQQRDLLLDNPILVFNKSENKDSLEYYSVFFILNIHYINTNLAIKKNLIRFFLSLYYKKVSIKTTIISLIHLQILYFGSISYLGIHMFDDDDSFIEICDITNTFFIEEPSMNITFLKILLDEYLEKYKTVEEFMENIKYILFVPDKSDTDKSDTEMVSILKKHHKLETVISYDMRIDKSYDYTFIKLLFGESKDIYVIESSDKSFIYLLGLEYYINIIFNTEGIIEEVFYNGNRVLKPSEIKLPFISLLPVAGVYLIYEKEGKYYVVSFIHNNLQLIGEKNVLDPMRFKSRVLTIPISSVNRYYPATPEGWKNLDYVIEAYGYNQLNAFFVTTETKNGYVITRNEMKYVKKTYLNFDFNAVIEEDKDELDIPFDFSEDILDIKQLKSHPKKLVSIARSLLKMAQITKSEYSIMMNDNMVMLAGDIVETYGSCNKLSHKVNKLSLTTLPVKSDLTNYQLQIDTQMKSLKTLETFTEFKDSILDYMPYIRYIKTETLLESLFSNSETKTDSDKMSLLASNMDLFKSRKHKYEYFFEYFFEFTFGSPTEEQFQIYKKIIGNYDDKIRNQYQKMIKSTGTDTGTGIGTGRFKLVKMGMYGGNMVSVNDALTTIQHFMMGKGKSSVLTPLLTMYFVLNHRKTVYIVVPEHLKKQTDKIMKPYIKIFNIGTVKIVTNIELYILFFEGEIVKDSIFLIDEIDSLVDPLKSNFNLIRTHKDSSIVTELYQKITSFIQNKTYTSTPTETDNMLYDDIKHHRQNLKGNLKYNINWGIHPTKAYAIPFINKDKPALESTFSSIILTLFLTYYYYHILAHKDKKLSSFLKTYIRQNKLKYKYGLNKIEITDEDLDTLYDRQTEIIQDVISTIQITETQANISFVDLLLKDDVYKIGYSGTVNVKFPKVESIKYEIYEDKDEAINIAYALSQANIVIASNVDINRYDAFIDICGHFKDKSNEEQARVFKVDNKAIIFIDEYDNVKYIDKDKALEYSDDLLLVKPRIYFDQEHTVGIDIKQDRYSYMKALCYVSLNSKYSDIAQGMYRMQKLNAGQTVDLFLVDPEGKLPDISQLYNRFKDNQTDYVLASEPLLNFQTVKALVRKERSDNKIDAHTETVKYYFEVNDERQGILQGILEGDHTELFTEYGLNDEKLKELVYNRKSDSQQKQQQKQQVHQEQQTHLIYKMEYKYSSYISNIRYSDTTVMERILYLFIAYKCSEHVYFLDDIFDKYENKNGFCFVKLDDTKNDLLLICAKHSIYFHDKSLYTLYLEPLNGENQIFDKLKDTDMFIKAIFSMVDNISVQSPVFKAVLYTVLFTLKSDNPLHLNYINSIDSISELLLIFGNLNKDYTGLTDDEIKIFSHKIVDDDGKVIIYYIQGLKFEKNTKYLYVVLGDDLLLIDESVMQQFKEKIIIEQLNTDNSQYANNQFVTIMKNGYNHLSTNDKMQLSSDSYLNSLTYLVLMCMKVKYIYTYDQENINFVNNSLFTYQKQFKDYYYNTKKIIS